MVFNGLATFGVGCQYRLMSVFLSDRDTPLRNTVKLGKCGGEGVEREHETQFVVKPTKLS